MKPLSALSRMPANLANLLNLLNPRNPLNPLKTIRLLTAFSVATLLGAPLTLGQEETRQEPPTASMPAEAPPPPEPLSQNTDTASTEAYARGLRHYRNRNFTEALQELGHVSQTEPDRADVFYLMGYCHYVLKHFEDSLDAFRRTFEVDPDFDPRGIYQARYRPEGP